MKVLKLTIVNKIYVIVTLGWQDSIIINLSYLHFQCESLNEPLHLRCGSYIHEQIDLSHTHIRAI